MGRRKDHWQAQYRAESFSLSVRGRIRLLLIRLTALDYRRRAGYPLRRKSLPGLRAADSSQHGQGRTCRDHGKRCACALLEICGSDLRRRSDRVHRRHLRPAPALPAARHILRNQRADPEQPRGGVRPRRRGHEIGVHAGHIRRLTELPLAQAQAEIDQTSKLIEDTTGRRPKLFRPAYGDSNDAIETFVANENIRQALWTLDTND
ncbi:MAG: peptidoglycan-N-acetylglucosamine deacetylase, partial [Propionibacteriaceae bacterium]|nr:peptidoglycan-N-acetylglucosamine deacetylase [Propionibacteriaceae bacterium]